MRLRKPNTPTDGSTASTSTGPKSRRAVILGIIAVLALSGLITLVALQNTTPEHQLTLTAADSGQTIHVLPSTAITVTLDNVKVSFAAPSRDVVSSGSTKSTTDFSTKSPGTAVLKSTQSGHANIFAVALIITAAPATTSINHPMFAGTMESAGAPVAIAQGPTITEGDNGTTVQIALGATISVDSCVPSLSSQNEAVVAPLPPTLISVPPLLPPVGSVHPLPITSSGPPISVNPGGVMVPVVPAGSPPPNSAPGGSGSGNANGGVPGSGPMTGLITPGTGFSSLPISVEPFQPPILKQSQQQFIAVSNGTATLNGTGKAVLNDLCSTALSSFSVTIVVSAQGTATPSPTTTTTPSPSPSPSSSSPSASSVPSPSATSTGSPAPYPTGSSTPTPSSSSAPSADPTMTTSPVPTSSSGLGA